MPGALNISARARAQNAGKAPEALRMSLHTYIFDRVTEELRLQLDGVRALAERLSRERLSPDASACVEGIREAMASASTLLADSLRLREAAQSAPEPQCRPQRLRDLMDELQTHWDGKLAGRTGLVTAYEGPPQATALIDRDLLFRIFDGLIATAIEAGAATTLEAALRAVPEGDQVRIEGSVRTGGNIRGAGAASLFDLDRRHGIGAALSAALGQLSLEALGGAQRTQPNPGGGETALFEFTTQACAEEGVIRTRAEETAYAAHILIVDDNATNRMVAETLCTMFECTSETANDGQEALEAARTGRFDVILMDIKMPVMDGVTATRAIRRLPAPAGNVPIIALTANADPEDAARYEAAGMNGLVEKPMKPETLLAVLQSVLDEAQDRQGGAGALAI